MSFEISVLVGFIVGYFITKYALRFLKRKKRSPRDWAMMCMETGSLWHYRNASHEDIMQFCKAYFDVYRVSPAVEKNECGTVLYSIKKDAKIAPASIMGFINRKRKF